MKKYDADDLDPLKKKHDPQDQDDSGTEEGGAGGKTGAIGFHYKDALSTEPRDDELPAAQTKHLVIVHKDLHEDRVKKQKITRKEREALKQGRQAVSVMNKNILGRGGSGGTS